jgi:23S rRNA (adenine2503-C2)-methyltransferase
VVDDLAPGRARSGLMEGSGLRPNLVGRTADEIAELVTPLVDRPFRARQVARWILHRDACSFAVMTDLPLALREHLAASLDIREPRTLAITTGGDDARKYLLEMADGLTIEGVAMRDRAKLTLCLSSQGGCGLGCRLCVTGALGPGRNLAADEIVGQYRVMLRSEIGAGSDEDEPQGQADSPGAGIERVNIVFMGMGEPLLNRSGLSAALAVLNERVSPKRITVSTAGVVPGIRWLGTLERRPKLAVSLNAPDQERRARLMPIAETYPLDRLMAELRRFPLERGRRITFEYVIIDGFNDAEADARALVSLIGSLPSKINVIPFNEDPEHLPGLYRPSAETIDRFARAVRDGGRTVTVRWSRGSDVAAACGQLKGARSAAAGLDSPGS